MDLDYVSVHKLAKKELGQYPAILTSHLVNNPYLLTKCEVKMAGYWPSSFFACLWTETKSSHRKKRTRPTSSHLDRTNLVNKGFIVWLLVKFCLRDKAGSPERARWLHLARSGTQSQRVIWFILPAHGTSHIINYFISPYVYLYFTLSTSFTYFR